MITTSPLIYILYTWAVCYLDHKSITVTKWKGEEEINGDKGEMRVYYTINKINIIKCKTRKHKSCSHCYYHWMFFLCPELSKVWDSSDSGFHIWMWGKAFRLFTDSKMFHYFGVFVYSEPATVSYHWALIWVLKGCFHPGNKVPASHCRHHF